MPPKKTTKKPASHVKKPATHAKKKPASKSVKAKK